MTRFSTLAVIAALLFAAPALATIPSFGTQTAESIRSPFNDSDFKLSFEEGTLVAGDAFSFRLLDLTNFPVLAGQDVQSTLAQATLEPGATFPSHSHPRSSETFIATKGKFETFFVFEGLVEPRVVKNILRQGEVTVFPQGLVHGIKCLSSQPCVFTVIFNSADPGTSRVRQF